ncbi:MAG: hypothetical protein AAF513_02195 [Pseudomonadota bacterium]
MGHLLFAVSGIQFLRATRFAFLSLCVLALAAPVAAIPPNTPITNTAVVDFSVGGNPLSVADDLTLFTDPGAGNSPPVAVALGPDTIAENTPGAVVGTLVVTDLDPGDAHTFAVADPRFEVVAGVLRLVSTESVNFEAEPTIDVQVTVTDGAGGELITSVTVVVTNVNEAPTDIVFDDLAVSAGIPGAVVTGLATVDPDAGDAHTYTVDDPRFEVVNGVLKLLDDTALNLGETVVLQVTTTDLGGLSYSETITLVLQPPGGGAGVNSSINVYQHAPGSGSAQTLPVAPATCVSGGGTTLLANPFSFAGGNLTLPDALALAPQNVFKAGASLFLFVIDPDANLDNGANDEVLVTVTTGRGDSELIRIVETLPDSGVFVGYVPTEAGVPTVDDCLIQTGRNESVEVSYVDANDSADQASYAVLVDPAALVFATSSGQPVDAALVELIDTATGVRAQVFADDGVTPVDAAIRSGDSTLNAAPGEYRFPYVPPGTYRLQVTPPNRFVFPSAVADADLQALPGAPYFLSDASRGTAFGLDNGPAVRVDIPLDIAPLSPAPSSIEVFGLQDPSSASNSQLVQPVACLVNASFGPAPAPVSLASGTLSLPATLTLNDQSARFVRGDVIFIKVTDRDQDLDPFAADQIEVTLTLVPGEDAERLRLTETGASTGEFTGYVQTASDASVTPNNCVLEASAGAGVDIAYVDPDDNGDTATGVASLDPGFVVFYSVNGSAIDGARVTLIDDVTGLPADGAVFAADGVTAYPATITSGGQVVDAGGQTYDLTPGTIFFPVIAPGTYRLSIAQDARFAFPSQVADALLNALPNGPYVLQPGSRGQPFVVTPGNPFAFDVPLDPVGADLFLSKQASKDVAAPGDFVQYLITLTTTPTSATNNAIGLRDTLPQGLRYVAGSLRVDGQPAADPTIGPAARTLDIQPGTVAPGQSVQISYVVEVTVGAREGTARNVVVATGADINSSNEASATIEIREDLFADQAILMGRVTMGECDAQTREPQEGVRVWLETGEFAVTDANGKYHFAEVEPGTHTVQIDAATLPPGFEPVNCEQNSRAPKQGHARFVDVQGGTLWRADFALRPIAGAASELVTRLDAEVAERQILYTLHLRGGSVPLQRMISTVLLDDQLSYVPGSARLNGNSVRDPQIAAGAINFRLPGSSEAFAHVLQFHADVLRPEGELVTQTYTRVHTADASYRTQVNTNKLSVYWPSNWTEVVSGADPLAVKEGEYRPESGNSAALQRAQRANAEALPQSELSPQPDVEKPPSVDIRAGVHEPGTGGSRSRSNTVRTDVNKKAIAQQRKPYILPEQAQDDAPEFSQAWAKSRASEEGILWPPRRHNPTDPALEVALMHATDLRPQLLVDGKLVSPLTFEGTVRLPRSGKTLSVWDNVSIPEADSVLSAQMLDADGELVQTYTRQVHYSGAPARAEWLPEQSYLVADGLHPPMLAIRFYDRAGYPLRAGTTGEFTVAAPYAPLDKTKHLETKLADFSNQRYKVIEDGIAYLQLEPTTITGEVELRFQFDQVRSERIRARLTPGVRDWILVGLAEGVVGAQDIERGTADDSDLLRDGRVAFYAKGMVRGDWLITAAYDTDKAFAREIREQIDPNRFYTLYGDGTTQLQDAQSRQKFYFKMERARLIGGFGDFDTELSRAELSRYERRLNGIHGGYFGTHVEVRGFAASTTQSFVRDELAGDGTSGVYRLSASDVVRNSELLRVVTRDRFRTERVIEEQTLTRFVDYTIDYERGTLIFKQPIASQDRNFNPTFIVVEYETDPRNGEDELVVGGRVAYRLDDQDSEVSLTYVQDDNVLSGGDLIGLDFTWQMDEQREIVAEVARSDGTGGRGDGYLLRYRHQGEQLAGQVYARSTDTAFGLGQQSVLEAGTRSFGVEGEYRPLEGWLLTARAFNQRLLETDAQRSIVDAIARYQAGRTQLAFGARGLEEETSLDERVRTAQLLAGASRGVLGNRLLLRADAEVGLQDSGSRDYPSRAIVGAEYKLFGGVDVIAEQEFGFGDAADTRDTRFGVRARPWRGADVTSTLSRAQGEDGERLFATTGLLQQVRMDQHWLLDFGLDRVDTLRGDQLLGSSNSLGAGVFNPAAPVASGSVNNDFTASFVGLGYQRETWNATTRLEFHQGDLSDKWNWLAGATRQLAEGRALSASMSLVDEETDLGARNRTGDVRIGGVWRPQDSAWTWLNRLDLTLAERLDGDFDIRSRKLVNNLALNYKPAGRHQLALHLGIKYVIDHIDDAEYSALTALYGVEYRYDLARRWDIGLHGSARHSVDADVLRYSAGVSLGRSLFDNMWLSLGYNVTGFDDDDFVGARYTSRGPYFKMRMRLEKHWIEEFLRFTGLERTPERARTGNRR